MAESRRPAASEINSATIVAAATPSGRGALAVVRLSGSEAARIACGILPAGTRLRSRRARVLWLFDEGERLDRAVVTLFSRGSSYTGEETVEFSVHGSPFIVGRLIELCLARGARPARPGEFTQRAYLNGRLDLAQAEAVAELIASKTGLSHRAAVEQLEGGLSRATAEVRDRLVELAALFEANLDHPDEDIPPIARDEARARLREIAGGLESLRAGLRRGRSGRSGARIAIAGAPNAGKSSLLNALVGRDRAIVSPEPGTTRDAVSETADLGGIEALLFDTAGLRGPEAGGRPVCAVEAEGQRRALSAVRGSDLSLLVVDRTLPAASHRAALESVIETAGDRPVILALNKSDLPAARTFPRDFVRPGMAVVEISAAAATGLDALVSRIRETLQDAPASGEGPIPAAAASQRHENALAEAAAELSAASAALDAGEELAALHLRAGLDALDEISGKTATEDILAGIFSRFCVGK